MERYLVSIGDVKRLTAVTNNVEDKHVYPHLKTAQQLKMMPRLGLVYMQSLLDQMATKVVIASATAANPVVVTTDDPHVFDTGDSLYIESATGMTEINGQWTITKLSSTTFQIDGLDGTAFSAYNIGSATVMRMSAADVAVLPYVLDAAAWWVVAGAIPFIYMHITNSTIVVQGIQAANGRFGGDGGTAVSDKTMMWMEQRCQNIAEGYSALMIEYLDLNSTQYPLWTRSCTFSGSGGSALGNPGTYTGSGTGMQGATGRPFRRPFRAV